LSSTSVFAAHALLRPLSSSLSPYTTLFRSHGIPELPSAMIYLRGLAFSYAMAASGMWLGFDEAALRLPAALVGIALIPLSFAFGDRKSTRLNSSHVKISYAVFCLKKKNNRC